MTEPARKFASEENWDETTLEELNIVVKEVDATEFFGAPSESLPAPELPHTLVMEARAARQRTSRQEKFEQQFSKLLEDVGSWHSGDHSVDLIAHILSVLDYDAGDFRIHRNMVTELKMGGELIECKIKAGITNGCEQWPSLVVQQVPELDSPPTPSEKYAQAIGAAISVVDEETSYHIYEDEFDFVVPVIVVDDFTVDLLKVPVNRSLLEAVKKYECQEASMTREERSVVEILEAGQIDSTHAEAEKKLEVYRHLEAFKRYVLELNQAFVAHRSRSEAEDWENRFKKPSARGSTPCNVDVGSLQVETVSTSR